MKQVSLFLVQGPESLVSLPVVTHPRPPLLANRPPIALESTMKQHLPKAAKEKWAGEVLVTKLGFGFGGG